jgi:hypothetical protein
MIKNIYHRYLNIPVDPQIDLFNREKYDTEQYAHIRLKEEEINPELARWFKQFNIEIYWYEAFYTPPNGGKLPVHTDSIQGENYTKINWTYGAPGSKLIWWEPKSKEYIATNSTVFGVQYCTIDEAHCTKVYEAEINKPSLINASQFHSTFNPTTEGRWTFTIQLSDTSIKNRVSWDDAIKRFEGIIL